MIARQTFYDAVRPLFGKILSKQLEGMQAILNEWERRQLTDLRWLAYILATAFHETAKTMQPVREYGRGKGRAYGDKDSRGHIYYGRGFVQLTWKYNYKGMGRRLNIDLVNNPDLALDMEVSTQIIFEGMIDGLFTGKKLSDYFNAEKTDWINARRIINGTDKAELISGYAIRFHKALT